MSHTPAMPRRNLLQSLAALVTLPGATRTDDREERPYSWTLTDQLGQRFLIEVYTHRPSDEQTRGRIVGADQTGRAYLVLSDADD